MRRATGNQVRILGDPVTVIGSLDDICHWIAVLRERILRRCIKVKIFSQETCRFEIRDASFRRRLSCHF